MNGIYGPRRLRHGTALVAACIGFSACHGESGIAVQLPASVAGKVAWIEVGAYEGSCLKPEQLVGGLPAQGAVKRSSFPYGQPPASLGTIPRKPYAFMAAARDENCAIIATGCTPVEASDLGEVSVPLHPVSPANGGCTNGAICRFAKCVPAVNDADPAVGEGCSMDLLGAGPLPNPINDALQGALISPPSIAPYKQGFLIAYRDSNPARGLGRLTLVQIDGSGGASDQVLQPTLSRRCPSNADNDGLGLFLSGDAGFLFVSRPACPAVGPGLNYFPLLADGSLLFGDETYEAKSIQLSQGSSVTPVPGRNDVYMAIVEDGKAVYTTASAPYLKPAAPWREMGPQTQVATEAMVASSSSAVAWLVGTSKATASPGSDSSRRPPTSRVAAYVVPSTSSLGADFSEPPLAFDAEWASVVVQGSRAAIASGSSGSTGNLSLRYVDAANRGTALVVKDDGFRPAGSGPPLYGALAARGDYLFLAAEQQGSITVGVFGPFGGPSKGAPAQMKEVFLPADPRVPNMATLRDGSLAISASDTRVAVAWVTARDRLLRNDPTGGYAVFACRSKP